jgi:hypothetical protein
MSTSIAALPPFSFQSYFIFVGFPSMGIVILWTVHWKSNGKAGKLSAV